MCVCFGVFGGFFWFVCLCLGFVVVVVGFFWLFVVCFVVFVFVFNFWGLAVGFLVCVWSHW